MIPVTYNLCRSVVDDYHTFRCHVPDLHLFCNLPSKFAQATEIYEMRRSVSSDYISDEDSSAGKPLAKQDPAGKAARASKTAPDGKVVAVSALSRPASHCLCLCFSASVPHPVSRCVSPSTAVSACASRTYPVSRCVSLPRPTPRFESSHADG